MWDSKISIDEVDDPAEIERHRASQDQFARNSRWLEMHWPDLAAKADGRFLAVAGEEAYLTDSPKEAWAWVERVHPNDLGPVVRYVMPGKGPRCYAHHWILADRQ